MVKEQKLQTLKAAPTVSVNRKRPIYIVLHVGNIQIGEFTGKASAPVKVCIRQ